MKTIYRLEVGVGNKGEGRNLQILGSLPFLPSVGMQIIAAKGDDYRTVEDIYWDSITETLEVYFEFNESAQLKPLLRLGWLIDG